METVKSWRPRWTPLHSGILYSEESVGKTLTNLEAAKAGSDPFSMESLMPKPKTKAVAELTLALHDLLRFYDTLSGHVGAHGVGWTYADIKRLEEIRALVTGNR